MAKVDVNELATKIENKRVFIKIGIAVAMITSLYFIFNCKSCTEQEPLLLNLNKFTKKSFTNSRGHGYDYIIPVDKGYRTYLKIDSSKAGLYSLSPSNTDICFASSVDGPCNQTINSNVKYNLPSGEYYVSLETEFNKHNYTKNTITLTAWDKYDDSND